MPGFLLDTNHVSEAIRPVSRVRERIDQSHRAGVRVGTCIPVLCELEVAIQSGSRSISHRRTLDRLLARVRIWPIDRAVARLYGEIYRDLRARGRVLSQVDIMLAALAQAMNLTVLTTDRDFDSLPDLPVKNWLD